MISEIAGVIGSINAAKDIVAGLNAIENQAAINEVKIELQKLLMEAQSSILLLHTEKASLAARIAEYEAFSSEAERYALQELPTGTLVYSLKESMAGAEPIHHLCPKCFSERKKSILQPTTSSRAVYICHGCQARFGFIPGGRLSYA